MSMPDLDVEISQEEKTYYYRLAGKIAFEVFEQIKELVKPGVLIIDICKKSDELIIAYEEDKAKPAFPCTISINNFASHYTSPMDDESTIPEESVVKINLGVMINGFIASKGDTISFHSDMENLVESSRLAWKNASELIRPGTETSMIGVAVEDTIKEMGFLPIRELNGHLLDRYQLHGNKMLPNIRIPFSKADSVIEINEVYAFETYATTGSGSVHEDQSKSYMYVLRPSRVSLRSRGSRDIRNFMFREYFTLPFAERWVMENPDFHPARVRLTVRELKKGNGIIDYSVLSDSKGSFVSHYSNTIIVTDAGYTVTTQPPFEFTKPDSIIQKENEEKEAKEDGKNSESKEEAEKSE